MNIAKLAHRLTPDDEPSPFSGGAPQGDTPPNPDPYGVRVMLRKNLRHLSIADLETDPPPQKFVLYPYFPAEQPSVFAAPGGTGKTTFLTYLAVCRALGRPMFGRPEMTPTEGETVILSTEDRLEDYRRKIAALRVELGEEFDARRVSERVHFLDLSGVPVRLVEAEKGNFLPTSTADHLAAVLREDVPLGLDRVSWTGWSRR